MTQQLEVLALPFVACLILTGIHAYLGIHVLSRKVIFVDIALAQIAALGATLAFLLGYDPRSEGSYWFSLAFAVLAAAVFALTRTRVERVPQEAVIGLTYAVAASTAILLADISPHGAEHLRDLLAGSIVWVTPHQVIKTGVLYSLIGLFHVLLRRRFLLISLDPAAAYAAGLHVRFWDFLFYLSFGVVITSSVQIAGVLLVFCYLVAPAVFAVMFADSLRMRLALGWGIGSLVSAVGLFFSYDRPSGPMIMVCFAISLILGAVVRLVLTARSRMRAATITTASGMILALSIYSLLRIGEAGPDADHQHGGDSDHSEETKADLADTHDLGTGLADLRLGLRDSHPAVRARAVNELIDRMDTESAPEIIGLLNDSSTAVRENAARGLGILGNPEARGPLEAVLQRTDEDEWVRLNAAGSLARLGDPSGLDALLSIARSADAPLARRTALAALLDLGGSSRKAGEDDAAGLEEVERWLAQHRTKLAWDPGSGTYRPRIPR